MDAEAFHVEFGGAPEHKWESPEPHDPAVLLLVDTLRYDIAMLGCICVVFVTFSCAKSQENHSPPLVDPIWPLQTL